MLIQHRFVMRDFKDPRAFTIVERYVNESVSTLPPNLPTPSPKIYPPQKTPNPKTTNPQNSLNNTTSTTPTGKPSTSTSSLFSARKWIFVVSANSLTSLPLRFASRLILSFGRMSRLTSLRSRFC